MARYPISSEKGITLAALVITVLLMMILTVTISMNSYQSANLKKAKNLENDIALLEQRINVYYATNQILPIYKEYTGELGGIVNIRDGADNDTYYIIDLRLLQNITLTYGEGFQDLVVGSSSSDVYIVNDRTHIVYYLKGIEIDQEIRYR